MKVQELMTKEVVSCAPETSLGEAALAMWRADCGTVPVLDLERKVVGMITDRDICMGLATSGKRPHERTVGEVMSRAVYSVPAEADVVRALDVMREHRVRRLPVTDRDGTLSGIVSMNDFLVRAEVGRGRSAGDVQPAEILRTMKSICTPSVVAAPTPHAAEIVVAMA